VQRATAYQGIKEPGNIDAKEYNGIVITYDRTVQTNVCEKFPEMLFAIHATRRKE
jgi:hypothetical protein